MGKIAQQLLALNSAKHAIRQAINDKGGGPLDKAAPLSSYPDAIAAIPTGVKAVVFFDYDGTIVASYSVEDFLELKVMPKNPEHDGLTAQGWNWSLANAQAYVRKYGVLYVGQMYKPTDGKMHLSIVLSATLTFTFAGIAGTVDWGDGSAPEVVTSGGSHTYAEAGEYEVTIDGAVTVSNQAFYNCTALRKVVLPETIVGIGQSAFGSCRAMEFIIIPKGVQTIANNAFISCYALRFVVIPSEFYLSGILSFGTIPSLKGVSLPEDFSVGVYSIDFNGCYGLEFVSPPENYCKAISAHSFRFCQNLRNLVIPQGVTSIGEGAFTGCYALRKLVLPEGIGRIDKAFVNCYGLQLICNATVPPTLQVSGAFVNNNPVRIFVPDDSVAAYKAATNWAAYANIIFPISALTD